MEENIKQEITESAEPKPASPEPKKEKKEAEFSIAWNLKVLAVIYVLLAVFYVILKIVLK